MDEVDLEQLADRLADRLARAENPATDFEVHARGIAAKLISVAIVALVGGSIWNTVEIVQLRKAINEDTATQADLVTWRAPVESQLKSLDSLTAENRDRIIELEKTVEIRSP